MTTTTRILLTWLIGLLPIAAFAQTVSAPKAKESLFSPFCTTMDLGLNVGTTGLGLDVSTPVTKWLDVRAGFSYMPRFNIPMTFGLESFDTEGLNTGKFSRMQELMKEFMGVEIDDRIKMNAKCTMIDFKFMLDFKPIPNNDHWRITAGFQWGSSKIGHIENTIYEMPTLVGVVMYNAMYDYFVGKKYMDQPIYNNTYIDPEVGGELRAKFLEYGRVGVNLGKFTNTTEFWEAGKNYIMEPDENCMVKANMFVNHFKPYIGAGYSTHLTKDKKLKLGIDAGALFWGGKPKIITHNNQNYALYDITYDEDGYEISRELIDVPTVNLSTDVEDIHGKVGRYVRFAKHLKVYPVLNFRISYTIF